MKVLILWRLTIYSTGDKTMTLRKQMNYKNRKKWKFIFLCYFEGIFVFLKLKIPAKASICKSYYSLYKSSCSEFPHPGPQSCQMGRPSCTLQICCFPNQHCCSVFTSSKAIMNWCTDNTLLLTPTNQVILMLHFPHSHRARRSLQICILVYLL